MQIVCRPIQEYSIRVYKSISEIDASLWNSIDPNIPFYQSHEFLSVIESIQNDLQFRYVVLEKNEVALAAIYVQVMNFSFKNLVNYSSDRSAGIKRKVKKYIGTKDTRVMNLGDVFFTGDKGIIVKEGEEIVPLLPLLFAEVQKSFTEKKPSAMLIANVYLQDEDKCMTFGQSAFHPFNTEPDMFMKVDPEWNSFEEYMNAFSSKYRVRAKKVLQVSKEIIQKEFSYEEIITHKNELSKLYNNVVNNVDFNMATLNINFFEKMKLLYKERFNFYGYYLNNELVSFACLFHVDPETLHVHYIGLNYEVNKKYKLYNRMLLDFVRFAIEHRMRCIHFGRTATEIKTTIGAEARPLHAYLKLKNPVLNKTLPYFLSRIKPSEFISRNPFKE